MSDRSAEAAAADTFNTIQIHADELAMQLQPLGTDGKIPGEKQRRRGAGRRWGPTTMTMTSRRNDPAAGRGHRRQRHRWSSQRRLGRRRRRRRRPLAPGAD